MSLIAWYPLNGDLKNQGIGDFADGAALNGLAIDNNGKIGKTYKWTTNGHAVKITNGMNLLKPLTKYSMACWAYMTAVGSYQGKSAFISSGNYNSSFMDFGIRERYIITFPGSSDCYNGYALSSSIALNTWHHYAITCDGTYTYVYLDGVLQGRASGGSITQSSETNDFYIGAATYSSVFTHKGMINDVRIYDHYLSPKEVKEISKGLVLHYPMNQVDGVLGGKNLLLSSHNEVSNNNYGTQFYYMSNPPAAGTTVTVAIDYTPAANLTQLSLYTSGGYSSPASFYPSGSGRQIQVKTFNMAYYTDRYPENGYNYITFYRFPNDGTITTNTTIHRVKMELGTKFTGFTTAPEDSPSQVFDNIIYDTSGFGNNGTVTTSSCPAWSDDAIIGSGSYKFVDSNWIKGAKSIPLTTEGTISFWFKSTSSTATQCLLNCRTATGNGLAIFLVGGKIRFDSNTSQWDTSYSYPANTWIHVVLVKDSQTEKLYINGSLSDSVSRTTTFGNLGLMYSIGASSTGTTANVTPSGNAFLGNLNDFRIYSTALSATDIKELYQTRHSVDNQGNIFTNEIIEMDDNLADGLNDALYNSSLSNGLSAYTQSHCQVSIVNNKLRIYRTPNLVYSSAGSVMWGGLRLHIQSLLQEQHTYLLIFHAEGKTSNSVATWYFTNNMGWSGGGLEPSPTVHSSNTIPSNFQGEMECYYHFTVSDALRKTCTSSYSSFVAGQVYDSYAHFACGWGYTDTGSLGTDIYFSNFRLYDITGMDDTSVQMLKNGNIECLSIDEVDGKFRIGDGYLKSSIIYER